MEYRFKADVVLILEHKKGKQKSNHVATEFNLDCSSNIDKSMYIEDGVPNKDGSHVLTNVLVQGLIGNIHQAHQNGFRDSAEHLRYIISELERGFVEVTEATKSNFS